MRTLNTLTYLAISSTIAGPLHGQVAGRDGVDPAAAPAVMDALIADVETVEDKLIALSDAIPEEDFDWRPGVGVRSVSEVLMHVAADNYFIPAFAGVEPPASTGIDGASYESVQAFEAREVDKAQAIEYVRASFAHLKDAMRNVDDQDLAATLDLFGQQTSGLELWVLTTTHLHEHLGQQIAYARANDVVPPWSQ